MVNYTISHTEIILVMLEYLREQGLASAMLELEEESKIQLVRYSNEVSFFRKIILKGHFEEAENFLEPLRKKKAYNIDSIIYEIRKQKVLELLYDGNFESEEMVELLQSVEGLCSKREFNDLCFLLNLNKLSDQVEYKNWNKMKGRLHCFSKARPFISLLYENKVEQCLCPKNRLIDLMKYALNYQFYISKQEDKETLPKYCSLLKDVVEQKTHKEFNSQHLKEFTLSFSKKYAGIALSDGPVSEDSLDWKTMRENKLKNMHMERNKYWNAEDEEEYVAQTINLDERKDQSEDGFYSTHKNYRSRFSKADTMSGVAYKNDGKINVRESIDLFGKVREDSKSPLRSNTKRRDSGVSTKSMMRLQSYRSIQHEPSKQEQSDVISRSNYSALKSQIDRFTCPKFDDIESSNNLTMKRNNSEDKFKAPSEEVTRTFERSQFHPKSVIDYDETAYNVLTMKEKGFVYDTQPIRVGWFSPDGMYFSIGTNSRWIKIWSLNDILESLKPESETGDLTSMRANQETPIVFDQLNYHDGSIYWIDWSENERLIATGSNDKHVKLLVNPILQETEPDNILELSLRGHRAKIRTVCFHPMNENVILSGGNVDSEIMVWDAETGDRTDTLAGHEGGTFWIKPSHYGTLFASVGKDRELKLWDLNNKDPLCKIDLSQYGEPDSIAISPDAMESGRNTAVISHECGTITYWDLNMQKLINKTQAHSEAAKGVSFSFDGRYITSAGYDHKIQIMNTDLEIVKTLEHDDKALTAIWHPFLPLLLTTSADKTAKVWIPSNIE